MFVTACFEAAAVAGGSAGRPYVTGSVPSIFLSWKISRAWSEGPWPGMNWYILSIHSGRPVPPSHSQPVPLPEPGRT